MEIAEAHALISDNLQADPGRFFCSPEQLPLGAGLVLSNVRFSRFVPIDRVYATHRGPVVVLTHECDIDQSNHRPLNHLTLVAPLIDFEHFVEEWSDGDDALKPFLGNLGHRLVSRVVYIPYCREDFLPYGALIYLNDLSSVPVSELEHSDVKKEVSLTEYGLRELDKMLETHFFRPKAVRIPTSG